MGAAETISTRDYDTPAAMDSVSLATKVKMSQPQSKQNQSDGEHSPRKNSSKSDRKPQNEHPNSGPPLERDTKNVLDGSGNPEVPPQAPEKESLKSDEPDKTPVRRTSTAIDVDKEQVVVDAKNPSNDSSFHITVPASGKE